MYISAFSTNAQSRFASVVVEGVPGTSAPSAAHLTVSGSNARDGDKEMLEGTEENSVSLTRGH